MAKYVIRAKIEIEGEVEKSDIIGAVFGFTEGMFGEEFDLRDLQDKGRIGRINVDIKTEKGRTVGEVLIPSNLDRVETALLGAMIEGIEKVGPYQAKIQVIDIVDVRAEKLKKIMERASELAKKFFVEKTPDLREVLGYISENIRIAELVLYGSERLPAGPDIDKSDTIIIVEGRADVINMLRYGYRNVIALEGAHGTKIPDTIVKLASRKNAILFVDGDRMGELIARDVMKIADIDYVARAPPGKEVEELTGKELAKALKNLVPAKQFIEMIERKSIEVSPEPQPAEHIQQPKQETATVAEVQQRVTQAAPVQQEIRIEAKPPEAFEIPLTVINEGKKMLGTLEAVMFDNSWNVIDKVSVRDLVEKLQQVDYGSVQAVVFDGIVTQRLLDVASSKGIKLIIGIRIGNISKKPDNIIVMTFQDIFGVSL
ncbi:MAG: DNA primase DnaG [Ignisphaera sp.]|nr:DNA primase DnaG [Ignisphaera sp.]MCX8168419.1 DNA primase DnaG [Ignisphaera sp.]MDW8086214.1 DNA primase DnaG [Ignisphaera sp.]